MSLKNLQQRIQISNQILVQEAINQVMILHFTNGNNQASFSKLHWISGDYKKLEVTKKTTTNLRKY